MLTHREATKMALDAFQLTPEGETVMNIIELNVRAGRCKDTPEARRFAFAQILLLDHSTIQTAWPVLQGILADAYAHTQTTEA